MGCARTIDSQAGVRRTSSPTTVATTRLPGPQAAISPLVWVSVVGRAATAGRNHDNLAVPFEDRGSSTTGRVQIVGSLAAPATPPIVPIESPAAIARGLVQFIPPALLADANSEYVTGADWYVGEDLQALASVGDWFVAALAILFASSSPADGDLGRRNSCGYGDDPDRSRVTQAHWMC